VQRPDPTEKGGSHQEECWERGHGFGSTHSRKDGASTQGLCQGKKKLNSSTVVSSEGPNWRRSFSHEKEKRLSSYEKNKEQCRESKKTGILIFRCAQKKIEARSQHRWEEPLLTPSGKNGK